jgi:preprotein translocase subunit SecA
MISLLSAGDTDILRDASKATTVFWSRVKRSPVRMAILGAMTAILLACAAMMLFGPELGMAWATPERVAIVFSPLLVIWLVYSGLCLYKFMPGRNDRVVLSLRHWVREQVDPAEDRIQALSADELRGKRAEFERRLAQGESPDDIRAEAYACVREASRRAHQHRQFECQLIGGKVIEDCSVAEMRTGEGKTIVCYMANFMKVLAGLKVHMVTVNDYLVRRDAEFCRAIFDLLGISVGYITSDMGSYGEGAKVRQENYACDITYGTNNEFGFDYLRDNMKTNPDDLVQGPQDFAVVDEVDSVLIDEARTPLIISGAAHDDLSKYQRADAVARSLVQKQQHAIAQFTKQIDDVVANAPKQVQDDAKFKSGIAKFRSDPMWLSSDEAEAVGFRQHFVVEMDRKSAHMTEEGAKAAQAELGVGSFYESRNMNWPHNIDNALKAHVCYQKDKEYVIQDQTIVIVDEFTGRLMEGRQWSEGLHQAVEAKERVPIKQETQTLATITLQNLFKLYGQLAGMTGTALTEADEFMKIYKLEVISIPTNRAIRRLDYNDKIYKSIDNKFDAIVEEIRAYSHNGYPTEAWTLFDMLREARKLLKERHRHDRENTEYTEHIQAVDDALKAFNDGRGEAEALERAYLTLAGEHVAGRPVLVGTVSVESSEKLSQALTRRHGVEHEVLNAKNHAREADIIVKAGQQHEQVRGKKKRMVGNVTIATNMAGRGTDIVLGPGVAQIGGLHVVGTERHESRRIDNQLRGRCGRQGDPGSTRFFLSFEDDLIRLFMGEWMLKMLTRFALEDGVPIEHKSLNKGIERAQKKVEDRNFGIRKNLLEYDEVPDQQRRTFYEMRRKVLMGEDLSGTIWEMLDQTVADEIYRYYDPGFAANCVVEWASTHLRVQLEAGKLDVSELGILREQVRELAINDVRGNIERGFGEYVDAGLEVEEWDVRGLIGWVEQFDLHFTQRQIKESDPLDLREQVSEAAIRQIEQADLTPIAEFVDSAYSKRRLIGWAREKFGVDVPYDDLASATREEAETIFREHMRTAYRKREIEYPVGAIVEYALRRAGSNRNAFYEQVARWTNLKFRLGWDYDHFAGKDPREVFEEVRDVNADFLQNGKLDSEIDKAITEHPGDAIVDWARERFGRVVEHASVAPGPKLREQLQQCGYEMLRFELTQLERMILLNTFDSAWKDHMYAMDLMRTGIGFRGYAERDPKIEFKREGTRLFNEVLRNIRARVTDLIFKVGVIPDGPDAFGDDAEGAGAPVPDPSSGGPTPQMTTIHADASGAAFSAERADQQSPGGSQHPEAKTFRREQPKVGRNDPCPCGSGKKFKLCHGKKR